MDPSHPETPEEAHDRLLRQTRLSEQIEELQGALGQLRLYVLSTPQMMVLIGQLRELRARRVAMGREPDDEVNAPVDMCCCNVCLQGAPAPQFVGGCPLHPRPRNCDGEPAGEQCAYLAGECEPDCPVGELTGAEFVEEATAALGGGLELTEELHRWPTAKEQAIAEGLDPVLLELPILPDVYCERCQDTGWHYDGRRWVQCDCAAGRTEAGLDAAEEAMTR